MSTATPKTKAEALFGDSRLPERFWLKVEVDEVTGCWNWSAAKYKNGYGAFGTVDGTRLAHRFAYEQLVEHPGVLVLDHRCHTEDCKLVFDCPHRACVNPAHLEPSTHRENLMRSDTTTRRNAQKTHCLHGHAYTQENTWYARNGSRYCRTCALQGMKNYRERRKTSDNKNQS